MVCEQHQRVGGDNILRGPVFLLNGQVIGAGQLLQGGRAQALVLLQLGGDDQPLAPERGQGRATVLPVGGQHVGINGACIGPQNAIDRVEKGAFAVAASAVCCDDPLVEHLPDCGHTGHLLEKSHQGIVATGDCLEKFGPDHSALVAGGGVGYPRVPLEGGVNVVGGYFPRLKVYDPRRGVEGEWVSVQPVSGNM